MSNHKWPSEGKTIIEAVVDDVGTSTRFVRGFAGRVADIEEIERALFAGDSGLFAEGDGEYLLSAQWIKHDEPLGAYCGSVGGYWDFSVLEIRIVAS